MSKESWVVRRMARSIVGPRGSDPAAQAGVARRLVVCGDDPLALRLVEELVNRYSADVVAIVPSRRRNHAPRIARLPRVRIVEAEKLTVETFRQARLQHADGLALVEQDDVGNIHAALQAQEVNPRIRLVIRMFNTRLGYAVHRLVHDCAVLSDAAMAAPVFVSAALGEVAPTHIRLRGRTLYVTRRDQVASAVVACGLAGGAAEDISPEILPSDPGTAELVLAFANGARPVVTTEGGRRGGGRRPAKARTGRLWTWLATIQQLISPKLRLVTLLLAGLLVSGTTALVAIQHDLTWKNAAYVTILTAFGGAEPDLAAHPAVKVLQALLTVVSIAIIPVLTAAVVEAVVNARLALTHGRLRKPISNHVVVVGLGNVGTRVIRQLHELGVPVVAVDKNEAALGAPLARQLGIPLIVGDAGREATLRAAAVARSRALVCLSTDDVTNLQAAISGQDIQDGLRVVLRLFDGDFADRAQRAFGITISRSVSYVAAPAFAAAMVERQVIGTIPIGRHVLLVAEAPVSEGSRLADGSVAAVHRMGQLRVIAVTTQRGRKTVWCPEESQPLAPDDVLTVVATRTGLARVLAATDASPGGDPNSSEGDAS